MEVIIGIDPHKASHTACAIDRREVELAQLRVRAGRSQVEQLLAWASPFGPRVWAIESAGGLGYLLSQQLVAAGEHVVDVPATLSSRIVQDLLRDELQFPGVILSDDLEMKAIAKTYPVPDAGAQAMLFEGGAWWRNFDDPVLNGLVETALARNNDLAAAAIRVRRAQYQAGLADDQLMPQFGGDANVSRIRNLYGDRAITRANSAELTVSYQVDLWGKLARQRDAAQWEALATEQDRQSAALSLVGTTATLYWLKLLPEIRALA